MKTKFFTLLFFMLISYSGFTQCEGGEAQINLDVNNIEAGLRIGGDLWWDGENSAYEFPKGSGRHLLFSGSLWMAGLDEGDNLHMAAQTYGGSATTDFWPGPIVNGSTSTDLCANWDRFFSVTNADIESHKADFDDNGTIDNPIPTSILGWPGAGNLFFTITNGFDLPNSSNLAPFFDRNQNGVYEPMEGDFPKIKGDQATWWVYNDVGNIHGSSMGEAIRMEIQVMAYAYENGVDAINNATFYEYKLRILVVRQMTTLVVFHPQIWAMLIIALRLI